MNIRSIIAHFVLILCSHLSFAQTIDDYVEEIGWGEFSTQYNYDRPAPEVKGEYYLFHDWVVAHINLYDGNKFRGKQLNLNLLSGDIEVPNGDRTRVLDKFKIKSIVIGDKKFVNGLHLEGSSHRNTFYEVLEEGKISVYCLNYSAMTQPRYGVPGAGNDRNYNSIIRQTYFVQSGPSMEVFTNSKKNNMKYFKSTRQAMEYIDKGKIKINRIKGFVKAAKFYNEQLK